MEMIVASGWIYPDTYTIRNFAERKTGKPFDEHISDQDCFDILGINDINIIVSEKNWVDDDEPSILGISEVINFDSVIVEYTIMTEKINEIKTKQEEYIKKYIHFFGPIKTWIEVRNLGY